MRAIYTEMVLSQSMQGESCAGDVFDPNAIVIRVEDNGGGPFLVIHGRMEDKPEGVPDGSISLDKTEIDQFVACCKALLAQAE